MSNVVFIINVRIVRMVSGKLVAGIRGIKPTKVCVLSYFIPTHSAFNTPAYMLDSFLLK